MKDTGGMAYPQNTVYLAPNGQAAQQGPQGGMTLRDYFAAKAIQGMWANGLMTQDYLKNFAATDSYRVADAMLEASK